MYEALKLCPSIYEFVLKAKVDANTYMDEVAEFETKVQKFYD